MRSFDGKHGCRGGDKSSSSDPPSQPTYMYIMSAARTFGNRPTRGGGGGAPARRCRWERKAAPPSVQLGLSRVPGLARLGETSAACTPPDGLLDFASTAGPMMMSPTAGNVVHHDGMLRHDHVLAQLRIMYVHIQSDNVCGIESERTYVHTYA